MKGGVSIAFRRVAQALFGDYAHYRIFTIDLSQPLAAIEGDHFCHVDQERVARAGSDPIRAQAWYGGEGAIGLGVVENDRLVAVQWYWYGERYQKRNFVHLEPGEAKCVQIFVLSEKRTRGLGGSLTRYAAQELQQLGFRRLYARVWHSHVASRRMFRSAGWTEAGRIIEVSPLRRRRPLRFVFPRKARRYLDPP